MILPYHVYSCEGMAQGAFPTHTVFVGSGSTDRAIDRAYATAKRLARTETRATQEHHVVTCDGMLVWDSREAYENGFPSL